MLKNGTVCYKLFFLLGLLLQRSDTARIVAVIPPKTQGTKQPQAESPYATKTNTFISVFMHVFNYVCKL